MHLWSFFQGSSVSDIFPSHTSPRPPGMPRPDLTLKQRASRMALATLLTWATALASAEEASFSDSGTFEVPAGVTSLSITALGGAGGGGGGGGENKSGGYGGRAATVTRSNIAVTPGQVLTITIGQGGGGGSGSTGYANGGGGGGSTSVSPASGPALIVAGGGGGGGGAYYGSGYMTNGKSASSTCTASGSQGNKTTTVGGQGGGGTSGGTGGIGEDGSNGVRYDDDRRPRTQGNSGGGGAGASAGASGSGAGSAGSAGSYFPSNAECVRAAYGNGGQGGSGGNNGGTGSRGSVKITFERPPQNSQSIVCPAGVNRRLGSTFPAMATANSPYGHPTGTVTFSNVAGSACSVASDGTLTANAMGACTYNASAAATNVLAAAGPSQCSAGNVAPVPPNLVWVTPNTAMTMGETLTLEASSDSGGAITYASADYFSNCTVIGNVVTPIAISGQWASCQVTATQAASGAYATASIAKTITITQGITTPPTIAWPAAITLQTAAPLTLSGIDPRAGAVNVASSNSSQCRVAGADDNWTVTGVSAGSNNCTITVSQLDNANFTGTSQSRAYSVDKNTPSLAWQATPALQVGVASTVSASSASTAPVRYSATAIPAGACTVDAVSGAVTTVHAGICTLTARQESNTNFHSANTSPLELSIAKGTRQITAVAPVVTTVGVLAAVEQAVTLSPSMYLEGNTVQFSSATLMHCSAEPSVADTVRITGIKANTAVLNDCQVSASFVATSDYEAAHLTLSLDVSLATPTLTWDSNPSPPATLAVGQNDQRVRASSTVAPPTGMTIHYQSKTNAVCDVDANTGIVTAKAQGLCTIEAVQSENPDFTMAAAPIEHDIAIEKTSQVLTFGKPAPESHSYVQGGSFAISPLASSNSPADGVNRPIVYTVPSNAATICAVNGTQVNILRSGTCILQANQAGDAVYAAATQQQQSIVITEAQPVLTWTPAPTLTVGDNSQSTTAHSSITASDINAIAYSSNTPEVCTINSQSGLVQVLQGGDCTVRAEQSAKAGYYQAAVAIEQTVVAEKIAQVLTFQEPIPAEYDFVHGNTYAISPQATSNHTDSSRPVTYSSLSTSVCSVTGTQVTMRQAGTCTIAADQAGDTRYAAASQVTQSVQLRNQKIFSGTTLPIAGNTAGVATVSITGGGDACGFDLSNGNTAFEATPSELPPGRAGAQGQLKFKLLHCDASNVQVTIQWPERVGGLMKYGKATANAQQDTYFLPPGLVISADGLTTTYTLKDGALGDNDWVENGEIVDPVVSLQAPSVMPGVPGGAIPVPLFNLAGLALLSLFTASLGFMGVRRQA